VLNLVELVEVLGRRPGAYLVDDGLSAWIQLYAGPDTDVISRADFQRAIAAGLIERAGAAHYGTRWISTAAGKE
jgi:hypothetical protein